MKANYYNFTNYSDDRSINLFINTRCYNELYSLLKEQYNNGHYLNVTELKRHAYVLWRKHHQLHPWSSYFTAVANAMNHEAFRHIHRK